MIKKDLGIDNFNFHSLRHTHATMLIEAGANIKDVSLRLGHSIIETTLQIYTHQTKEKGLSMRRTLFTFNDDCLFSLQFYQHDHLDYLSVDHAYLSVRFVCHYLSESNLWCRLAFV